MNRYPLWKYVLIGIVLLIGLIYAAPNLFPSQPAVQLSSKSEEILDATSLQRFEQALAEKGLTVTSTDNKGQQALFHFADTDTQLAAAEVIKETAGKDFVVALNLAPATPGWLRAFNAQPMYLGLDLRGGVHFLMEVDMKAAEDKALERYDNEFRDLLRDNNIKYLGVSREGDAVNVSFREAAERNAAVETLSAEYGDSLQISAPDASTDLQASMSETAITAIQKFALQQNITTLRKRVNELGVAEPIIQQQGANRIVVQLPGVQDTARAKEILGATATLEFRLVDESNDPFQAKQSGRTPIGSLLYTERDGNPVLLNRRVMLTGESIIDASSGFDENNRPAVHITLDGKGASRFSKVTGENVQKLMGVVFIETKIDTVEVNGELQKTSVTEQEVINVARIQEQLGKRFQITGLDSPKEARDLALLLRAGALAAPLYIVEERTVGPSLGKENIETGFQSVLIGFALVLIFMAVYYRVFGLVANVALTMNVVLVFAMLSMLQATLTLPGIAGIVLTIGMAVDANVLIFERIKEELRTGASTQRAIDAGYERALSTIADANITTLIAAIVLFGFGTGPIKGFAITLALGIISSMFTAIVVSRALINLIYGNRRTQTLSI